MTELDDSNRELTLEHRILIQVRRVLAKVVRDITPPPGTPYPLPQSTIDDIRDCFALIAARERELGAGREKSDIPVFRDGATQIVDFESDRDE